MDQRSSRNRAADNRTLTAASNETLPVAGSVVAAAVSCRRI